MSTLDFLATPLPPSRPYHVLRHRDFRLLWGSQFVSLTGSQMQVVALNWHIYVLTGSPLALGLVGLTRVLPIIVFSLWGGIVADRYDRRRVMLLEARHSRRSKERGFETKRRKEFCQCHKVT